MRGDAEQQVQIAHHLVRFRSNGNAQPLARGHLLENRTGGPEFPFGRLVRVSGRTDSDVLTLNLFHSQVAPGKRSGVLLDVDLPLEISGIQFHVLVCVSRVTVLASEFTATIGVHRPGKRYAVGIAMVQDRAYGQKEVLRAPLGIGEGGGGGETGYADAFGPGPWWWQGIRPAVPLDRD